MSSNTIMASIDENQKNINEKNFHPLTINWTMYAHLPHDTDWSISSYKNILSFSTLEEAISLFESIPEKMTQNCMLFLMKNDIKPTWEDPENSSGGAFSFKVPTISVHKTWKDMCYSLIGNSITNNDDIFLENINGLTISPKRNFCIIKIWTKHGNISKLGNLIDIENLNINEVQYKKHSPEY